MYKSYFKLNIFFIIVAINLNLKPSEETFQSQQNQLALLPVNADHRKDRKCTEADIAGLIKNFLYHANNTNNLAQHAIKLVHQHPHATQDLDEKTQYALVQKALLNADFKCCFAVLETNPELLDNYVFAPEHINILFQTATKTQQPCSMPYILKLLSKTLKFSQNHLNQVVQQEAYENVTSFLTQTDNYPKDLKDCLDKYQDKYQSQRCETQNHTTDISDPKHPIRNHPGFNYDPKTTKWTSEISIAMIPTILDSIVKQAPHDLVHELLDLTYDQLPQNFLPLKYQDICQQLENEKKETIKKGYKSTHLSRAIKTLKASYLAYKARCPFKSYVKYHNPTVELELIQLQEWTPRAGKITTEQDQELFLTLFLAYCDYIYDGNYADLASLLQPEWDNAEIPKKIFQYRKFFDQTILYQEILPLLQCQKAENNARVSKNIALQEEFLQALKQDNTEIINSLLNKGFNINQPYTGITNGKYFAKSLIFAAIDYNAEKALPILIKKLNTDDLNTCVFIKHAVKKCYDNFLLEKEHYPAYYDLCKKTLEVILKCYTPEMLNNIFSFNNQPILEIITDLTLTYQEYFYNNKINVDVSTECIDLLIQYGADPTVITSRGSRLHTYCYTHDLGKSLAQHLFGHFNTCKPNEFNDDEFGN